MDPIPTVPSQLTSSSLPPSMYTKDKKEPMLMNEEGFTNNPNFGAIFMRNLLETGCFRKVEKPNFPKKKDLDQTGGEFRAYKCGSEQFLCGWETD
jgi:hypothetical protein